jgi:hypothetical protein
MNSAASWRKLVLLNRSVGEHGWSHGDRYSATADVEWLARNFGLPIRGGAR